MKTEELREFVLSSISSNARFDGTSFSLEQSYDEYLVSHRSILALLSREVSEYESNYDFNLKKARYFLKT